MNHITKTLSLLVLAAIVFSCQKTPKSDEKTEKAMTETDGTKVEEVPTEDLTVMVLNPNLATQEQLSTLLPEEITTLLTEKRPFLSMTDLDAFIGTSIDSAQKVKLYNKIFVPFNLNTTPEEDFKLIPGVGKRMAHEFEEYRPYVNIAQFRREIGKYVDEAEVARYENFVFVPVELNTASKEEIMAIPGVGERMHHEFEEYRPYKSLEQFRKEIGKYVDEKELARLERYVYIK